MPERSFTFQDTRCAVDAVCGYTVMAVCFDGYAPPRVALAFCSPKDRLAHRWSRTEGLERCMDRSGSDASALPFRTDWTVRDYIIEAALRGHTYIPHAIRKRIRNGARWALVIY